MAMLIPCHFLSCYVAIVDPDDDQTNEYHLWVQRTNSVLPMNGQLDVYKINQHKKVTNCASMAGFFAQLAVVCLKLMLRFKDKISAITC